ncbi:lysosomal thioesterase ppt2 [Anaeramoeba flamelloides]|uniref:Lysosomal thioesterase ppt2 n=1 Tax=Anaeramoeba flamelloides TaxID=1746091 RepID=A0ABQ8Y4J9_9EUKA|nr:lysosomal thioesterase ppt2 [Anaeramoeba flamelloides]
MQKLLSNLLIVAIIIFAAFSSLECKKVGTSEPYPVVLMHGIGADSSTMDLVVEWIHKYVGDSVYVKNVEIGNGYWNSIMFEMDKMVDDFSQQVINDPILRASEKINVIGYSQGSLVTRGYIEKYNTIPVHNYITWSGPHMGIFGIPVLEYKWLAEALQKAPYVPFLQKTFTFAQYWKDVFKYDDYLKECAFLPYLNNERAVKNDTYRKNIMSLNQFVLVMSNKDTTIVPKESSWFSFWDDKMKKIIPYNTTQAYKEDWIGLRTLNENGRLQFRSCDCHHPDYPKENCLYNFIDNTLPFLK